MKIISTQGEGSALALINVVMSNIQWFTKYFSLHISIHEMIQKALHTVDKTIMREVHSSNLGC